MTTNVFLSGNASVDYHLKGATPKVNGGAELMVKAGNGLFHSDTEVIVGTKSSVQQKFGCEIPLYSCRCCNSWEVGLDVSVKGGASVDLTPHKHGKSEESINNYVENFGTTDSKNIFGANVAAGLELIAKTPETRRGKLRGSFVEFGIGADVGARYESTLNQSSDIKLPEGSKLNKMAPYVNPYAEAYWHIGKSDVSLGAKVGLEESAIKLGYCF